MGERGSVNAMGLLTIRSVHRRDIRVSVIHLTQFWLMCSERKRRGANSRITPSRPGSSHTPLELVVLMCIHAPYEASEPGLTCGH